MNPVPILSNHFRAVGKHGQRTQECPEFGAPLENVLGGAIIPADATAGVIVQFQEDEETAALGGQAADRRMARKLARHQAIVDAGSVPERDFDNMPFHATRVTLAALKRLVNHPHVKRISIDHAINGNLHTTARAIGADQVWSGSSSMPTFNGAGINVAVLDSGMDIDEHDLIGQIAHCKSFKEKDLDENSGHGIHVGRTIAGSGANSVPSMGFPVQHKGIASGAKLISVKVLDQYGSETTSGVISGLR